jgi:hypothetical protein
MTGALAAGRERLYYRLDEVFDRIHEDVDSGQPER